MRLLIGQAGAPTVVVDQSVRGFVEAAAGHEVLAACGGPDGLVNDRLEPISLDALPPAGARGGSWLGAGRRRVTSEDLDRVLDVCASRNIDGIALIGGNGTMAPLAAVSGRAAEVGPHCNAWGFLRRSITTSSEWITPQDSPLVPDTCRLWSRTSPAITRP